MSEFFRDYDDIEEKTPSKKQAFKQESSSTENEDDKISNKDKKLLEMQEEILELEEKTNTKKIELFLKNSVKKYKSILKNGIPSFLGKYLDSLYKNGKISQALKSKLRKFDQAYERVADEVVENNEDDADLAEAGENVKTADSEGEMRKKQETVNREIIEINKRESEGNQKIMLGKLLEETNLPSCRCKILLSLVNLKIKTDNYKEMEDLILQLVELTENEREMKFLDIDILKVLSRNVYNYFGAFLNILKKEDYERFKLLISKVKFWNEERVNLREIEFDFFFLDKVYKTEDLTFKLMYLVKNKDYKQSLKYYNENGLFKNLEDVVICKIINELGTLALYSKDYEMSFDLLQKCYMKGNKKNEHLLNIMCVAFEDRFIDEDYYDLFIDNIRVLDLNPFLLESSNTKEEIYRAFYFQRNYDYETCSQILSKIEADFDCFDVLRENVIKELGVNYST